MSKCLSISFYHDCGGTLEGEGRIETLKISGINGHREMEVDHSYLTCIKCGWTLTGYDKITKFLQGLTDEMMRMTNDKIQST